MGGGKDRKFSLIRGREQKIKIKAVAIEVIGDRSFPLPVDVRVFEEDTHLVLTVDPVMRYTEEHPIKLMTGILNARPKIPGSVSAKGSSWYAVVHDLDAEPVCRREWIESAYRETLQLAEDRNVRHLGLPLLGTVHGRFSFRESLKLLIDQLPSHSFAQIRKIVLLVPEYSEKKIQKMLTEMING